MQTNSVLTKFEKELQRNGLRNTAARRSIFMVLSESPHPLAIQEIASRTTDVHFVSVYRSIDALLKAGLIKQVPQGFKNRFELSDTFKPHHHHATCEFCGSSWEINSVELESLMKKLTIEVGLVPTKHHFEIDGVCANCQTEA